MTSFDTSKVYEIDGKKWRLVKAAPPTPEEAAAIKAKQDACKHDSGMLLLSNPPLCPLCHKAMK